MNHIHGTAVRTENGAMRRRKWMVWGIAIVVIYGTCNLPLYIKYRDQREVFAAWSIAALGEGGFKYWICIGRQPSSGDDLIRCGLLVSTDDPQWLFIRGCGLPVKREYAETAIFAWPSEHAAWRLAGDTVVDEQRNEMPPIVRLECALSHPQIDYYQKYLKRLWLEFQQRETAETTKSLEWIFDCNDVISEE